MTTIRLFIWLIVIIILLDSGAFAQSGHPSTPQYPVHQVDTIKLLDSVYAYFWHKGLNAWVNYDLDLYYYDDNTNVIKWNRKHWDESYGYIWYDDFRVFYTIQDGVPSEELKEEYNRDTKEWINSSLFTYQYDDRQNRTEWKWQKWSASRSDWINFRLNQYMYTDTDLQTQSFSYIWEPDSSSWLPSQRMDFFYDSIGNDTLVITLRWSSDASEWIYLNRKASFYDTAGAPVQVLTQFWDLSTSSWLNSSKSITYYDPTNHLIRTIFQHWDSDHNLWRDKSQTVNYFNENDLVGSFVTSLWESTGQTWVNVSEGFYEYDEDGDKTGLILQFWNENQEWENSSRMRYVYKKVLDVPESIPRDIISCTLASAFPGTRCLRCNGLKEGENYQVRLYSLQGSIILSRYFMGDQSLYLNDPLQTGIYLLTILNDNRLVYRNKLLVP